MNDSQNEEVTSEVVENKDNIKKEQTNRTIGQELINFVEQISSLSITLQITLRAVLEAVDKLNKNSIDFTDQSNPFVNPDSNKTFLERVAFIQNVLEQTKQIRIHTLALNTIPKSYLITLISHYDAFLGRLIKLILLAKPELLTASDKNLSLAELMEFGSIENAKNYILEKEIEGALRKSHAEQFAWMESKFNIPLRQGLDIWSDFIEITERRNLYVHTGGVISSQYIKVCKENNVKLENINVGDDLVLEPNYFQYAQNVIFELAFKLSHVLWRKFLPDQREDADSNLTTIGYEDALQKENFELAQKIFDFGTQTLKKHSSEEIRLIMTVNRALAYKWAGKEQKAQQIISQEDWSATMTKFRLAEAVISEKYDKAYGLMHEIGKNSNQIHKYEYRNWSLFRAIRKETKFKETFEKIFGEHYEIAQLPSAMLDEDLSPNE